MFDSPLNYKFVQTNHTFKHSKSFRFVHIYKFYIHKGSSLRKYIVELKEYDNGLVTVDFYAKTTSPDKFRLMTNQNSGGKLGATILEIMVELATKTEVRAFGIVAAALLEEKTEANTKRFRVYKRILSRTVKNYSVFVFRSASHIFVVRKDKRHERKEIFKTFRKYFKENY